MKIGPRSSTKNDAEKYTPEKCKNTKKTTPKSTEKSDPYFRGGASWASFGGPARFWTLKMGPQRSQSASDG